MTSIGGHICSWLKTNSELCPNSSWHSNYSTKFAPNKIVFFPGLRDMLLDLTENLGRVGEKSQPLKDFELLLLISHYLATRSACQSQKPLAEMEVSFYYFNFIIWTVLEMLTNWKLGVLLYNKEKRRVKYKNGCRAEAHDFWSWIQGILVGI